METRALGTGRRQGAQVFPELQHMSDTSDPGKENATNLLSQRVWIWKNLSFQKLPHAFV